MYLSVIIPAYNEAQRLPATLEAVNRYLTGQPYEYEIIVVDDGSSDQTGRIVTELKSKISNLRLVGYEHNRGKGYAVKQGILGARGQHCLYLDADNAVALEQIENFWPQIKAGYDIVIGSIAIKGAGVQENAAWYRRILGRCSKYLIRILTVSGIKDTQRGFKLLSARAAKDIFPLVTIDGFGFDIELLLIASKRGYRIKEMPVAWINANNSKVNLASYFKTLKELIEIKSNQLGGKYDKPAG